MEEIMKDPWVNMGHGEELTMSSIESSLAAMTLGSLSGWCPWATRVKGSRTHRWARSDVHLCAPGCKRPKREDTITLQPLLWLIPSTPCKVQHRVSANTKQWRFSEPTHHAYLSFLLREKSEQQHRKSVA